MTMADTGKQYQIMCIALLLIFVTMASQAASRSLPEPTMHERHEQWMARHGRVYKDSTEKEERYKIFKANVEQIESFNKASNKPYKLGVNQFTDLTNEEFKLLNKFESHVRSNVPTSFKYENMTTELTSIDWREKGAVTSIKNQLSCGCCWAFSAVAAMEGINQITSGKLISLSEQELVDCDVSNYGCNGGYMTRAFEFIIQNGGLTTEANYPYMGTDGSCNPNSAGNNAAKITGYEVVPANSESALLNAVSNQPVSVGIDGSGMEFMSYASGIFTGPCGTKMEHAVTVVGYGVAEDGTKYWLVKNSWGTEWGEQGYMKIQRDIDDVQGLCGITKLASYPTA